MSFSSKISAVEKSQRVVYFKRRLIHPENVSFLSERGRWCTRGPAEGVGAGYVPSHSFPLPRSLFRKSHYGGRPCQTGGVSQVNICLEGGERGGGGCSSPSPENGACWLGPCCCECGGVVTHT